MALQAVVCAALRPPRACARTTDARPRADEGKLESRDTCRREKTRRLPARRRQKRTPLRGARRGTEGGELTAWRAGNKCRPDFCVKSFPSGSCPIGDCASGAFPPAMRPFSCFETGGFVPNSIIPEK